MNNNQETVGSNANQTLEKMFRNDPSWEAIQRRNDYRMILDIVNSNATVLDLGCGSGWLLAFLQQKQNVKGYGIELSTDRIIECVDKGLSVFQGNVDEGLRDFEDQSFDYVVLNQTLPVIQRPLYVVQEMVRVGRRAIISFANFAYLGIRIRLLLTGRMPVTEAFPYEWYNTPNIHPLTIKDFISLCNRYEISILTSGYFNHLEEGEIKYYKGVPNRRAAYAVFVVTQPS